MKNNLKFNCFIIFIAKCSNDVFYMNMKLLFSNYFTNKIIYMINIIYISIQWVYEVKL
jgi:hypothetical protein